MTERRRLPPIWLLGMTNATFGLTSGFVIVTLPQMLAAQGVPGGHIAAITSIIVSPSFWVFLIAPMLDVRFSRRGYAITFGLIAAAAAAFVVMHHHNLAVVEVVMTAGYLATSLYQGAVGGWTGSLISHKHDSSLGIWFTVSNTGSGGLTMLFGASIIRHFGPAVAASILAAVILLPLLFFLFIPAPGPDRALARETFTRFWHEVGLLVRKSDVLIAIALFGFPCASFALTNVLGGVGHDFSASEHTVSLFAGSGAVIAGIVGSFLLKPFARRFPLRPLYLGIGIVGACFTLSLLLLPRAPLFFGLAILGENVFQAFAFSASFAITFEVIGPDNPLAATLFSLLVSASNLPITYMTLVDGWGYDSHGVTGAFLTDAGISILACACMFLLLRWWSNHRPAHLLAEGATVS
jgi:MFS transporter, PAT family, beta-lactamase induction signal transducer AmpG